MFLHLSSIATVSPGLPFGVYFPFLSDKYPHASIFFEEAFGSVVQMCCLAEHSLARVVFDEVLAATVTEIIMKDGAKRKGWPVQEAFLVSSAF